MVNTDEISKNAIVLNATEPKQQDCNTDKYVAIPMSELNEILILLAIYEAFFFFFFFFFFFLEISQIY